MFTYPSSTLVNRPIHKTKLLENASASPRLKALLTDQIKQLRWHAKLSPTTLKIPATPNVPEIQIFQLILKTSDINSDLLDWIDKTMPQPIFFILENKEGKIAHSAAHKRPSDASATQWVTGTRFTSSFIPKPPSYPSLPNSLDLAHLYAAHFSQLLPLPSRKKEILPDHIQRCETYRSLQRQISQLNVKIRREKQFNRKVELNQQAQKMASKVNELTNSHPHL